MKGRQEAFWKLFWANDGWSRDTSYWRKAQFCDYSYSHGTELLGRCNVITDGVHKPFSFEEARKTFRKFKKFEINSENEISASSVSRFDAVVTFPIDSFKSDILMLLLITMNFKGV